MKHAPTPNMHGKTHRAPSAGHPGSRPPAKLPSPQQHDDGTATRSVPAKGPQRHDPFPRSRGQTW